MFLHHSSNTLTTSKHQATMKEKYGEKRVIMAFSNVKEDILELKREIKDIKMRILKMEHKITLENESSKGNRGVQATSSQHPHNILTTPKQQSSIEDLDKNLKDFDHNIKDLILSLTDREFLVFTAIYQQEDELKRPITYEELSLKLKLSQSHIRGCIIDLISKKVPLIKKRTGSKMFLSIKKEFRSLKIGAKLIDFRRSFNNQTNFSEFQ